MFNMAEARHF